MGKYSKALSFYEKDLAISHQSLPPNHLYSATSYGNIASAYKSLGDYSTALTFYERALTIKEESLLGNHPSLAVSFNNIGSVYRNMEEYSKALSFYEQALEIKQESLPASDLSLAHNYIQQYWVSVFQDGRVRESAVILRTSAGHQTEGSSDQSS